MSRTPANARPGGAISCLVVASAMVSTAFAAPPVSPQPPAVVLDPASLDPAERLRWIHTSQSAAPRDERIALLVDMALTDECEAVRYEAVVAIGNMLVDDAAARSTTVVYRQRPRGLFRRALSQLFGRTRRSRQYVCVECTTVPGVASDGESSGPPCCDRATRDALAGIAGGVDGNGQPQEPSPRIRNAAAAALAACHRAGECGVDSLPPAPSKPPGHSHPRPPFEIEEPPPGSAGFEPLASVR